MSVHHDRRERLRTPVRAAGLDALLVTSLPNARYLSGFTGSNATLLVGTHGGDDLLVTDGRYAEQAAAQSPDLKRVITRADDWLAPRLAGRSRLGVEGHVLTLERADALGRAAPQVELVSTPCLVETLRMHKDDTELAALRRACAITQAALADLPAWLRPGMTERDAGRRLLDELLARGSDDRGFDFVVASGPNGARPHHRPTDRTLARGDLVTFDVGARVDGYHADLTRTVALGEPDPRLRRIYALVERAQEAGRAVVRAGVPAAEVDAVCRAIIERDGHGDHFVHSTGHGIGLELHEAPILRHQEPARLADRMVVTVEPGIYLPGVGGVRIEDVVAVTDGGGDVLTADTDDLSRDLLVL